MILPPFRADWPKLWQELFMERAGIMEYVANFPRPEAERLAEKDIRWQAAHQQYPEIP